MRIRKLTPIECERLQGYPDNWTKFGRKPDGKIYELSNIQRYKLCGNGISSPVSKHILETVIKDSEVKIMSLFSGTAGTEQLLDPARFKVIGHSEFDKHASANLHYNFPDIPNYGDITKISGEELPDFNMLAGGFPCFAAGTLITTKDGLKKIEEIKIGDEVLTHTNSFKKVILPMVKISDHYNLVKVQGVSELKVTDEHPFYVRRKIKKCHVSNKVIFQEPEWIECKDLKKGDYIGVPLNKNSIVPSHPTLPVEKPEFWELIGKFLADGHCSPDHKVGIKRHRYVYSTFLSCNSNNDEVEKISKLIENIGFSYMISKCRTVTKVIISNQTLHVFLHNFGKYAHGKRLPGFVFDMPVNLLESLIEGYLKGDGFSVKHRKNGNKNQFGITSINLELLTGFQQIIQKVYRTQPIITKSVVPDKKIIEGRVVNQRNFYCLKFYKGVPKQKKFHVEDDYIWTPFKSRTKIEENLPVYNFEVEEDNSYCVHNLIVHNCQAWSESGLRKGFDDTSRGQLIYDVFRIVKNTKPKYILLENVKGLITHNKGRSILAIFEGLSNLGYSVDFNLVNSKDFGLAQNRMRIFIICVRNDVEIEEKPTVNKVAMAQRLAELCKQNPNINYKQIGIPNNNGKPTPNIADILEDNVDEKYFLRHEAVEKIANEANHDEKMFSFKSPKNPPKVGRDIAYCIDANYSKGTNTITKNRRQLIAYSKSTRENHIDHRAKLNVEANTLSTGDGCGNMSTQNFVMEEK